MIGVHHETTSTSKGATVGALVISRQSSVGVCNRGGREGGETVSRGRTILESLCRNVRTLAVGT